MSKAASPRDTPMMPPSSPPIDRLSSHTRFIVTIAAAVISALIAGSFIPWIEVGDGGAHQHFLPLSTPGTLNPGLPTIVEERVRQIAGAHGLVEVADPDDEELAARKYHRVFRRVFRLPKRSTDPSNMLAVDLVMDGPGCLLGVLHATADTISVIDWLHRRWADDACANQIESAYREFEERGDDLLLKAAAP
jgi:hypothetical protein